MIKHISKIYQRAAFIMLVIIISGLLNICLFAFQVKAATAPIQPLKFNFAYDGAGNCVAEPIPEARPTINRPAAPMPECCLAQNRNFNTIINTANDKSAPTFTNLIISPFDAPNFKNNSTHYTSRLTYPPPEGLALASIVIREWSLINSPAAYT